MRRIVILGAGGAGKTVLARQLGQLLGLPVTHLDQLRYRPDWTTVPEQDFVAGQRALVAGDQWIAVLLTELRRAFPQVSDGFGYSSSRLS
jgi:adenylate kinase family enzyme